ncbi:MAG: hypothetical protein R2941_15525 [Desulfobacterales bacterium]
MVSKANQYEVISGKEYLPKAAQTGSLCCFERIPDLGNVVFRKSPHTSEVFKTSEV